jgi:hypothetical protein
MGSSNRETKLKLFAEDSKCYYCRCEMALTEPNAKSLPPNAATIEHRISRYNPSRWRKKRPNEKRRVLACYKCNQDRSALETLCLSREEVLKRSKGWSLNPRGNPTVIQPLDSLVQVKKVLTA